MQRSKYIGLFLFMILVSRINADNLEYKKILRDGIPDIYHYSHVTNKYSETNFGLCQVQVDTRRNPIDGLVSVVNEQKVASSLKICLQTSIESKVNVLIFPEYSLSIRNETLFNELQSLFQTSANLHHMIIIGGTFYDNDRYARFPIFGNGWTLTGYKFGSSFYETELYSKTGTKPGNRLTILETDYGRFLIIIGIDLLSDRVQYSAKRLNDNNIIDGIIVLANTNNAYEYLLEINSMVRRHNMFVLFVNAIHESISENQLNHSYGYSSIVCQMYNDELEEFISSKLSKELLVSSENNDIHDLSSTTYTNTIDNDNIQFSEIDSISQNSAKQSIQSKQTIQYRRHLAYDNVVCDAGNTSETLIMGTIRNTGTFHIWKQEQSPDFGLGAIYNIHQIQI